MRKKLTFQMSSDELENTKNKTLETQIIQLMKGFQQPVPLGVFYRCFPKYNDRTIVKIKNPS